MKFKPGDAVVHISDRKLRKMVIGAIAIKELPPSNVHNTLVNIGQIPEGSYYCTWIDCTKKGDGYFSEVELEFQELVTCRNKP